MGRYLRSVVLDEMKNIEEPNDWPKISGY